jgi:hypothetical protein
MRIFSWGGAERMTIYAIQFPWCCKIIGKAFTIKFSGSISILFITFLYRNNIPWSSLCNWLRNLLRRILTMIKRLSFSSVALFHLHWWQEQRWRRLNRHLFNRLESRGWVHRGHLNIIIGVGGYDQKDIEGGIQESFGLSNASERSDGTQRILWRTLEEQAEILCSVPSWNQIWISLPFYLRRFGLFFVSSPIGFPKNLFSEIRMWITNIVSLWYPPIH